MCVLLLFSGKTLILQDFSFFLVTQVQKKRGKEKHYEQLPQEGRGEMPRNIIHADYKDCWIPGKKKYISSKPKKHHLWWLSLYWSASRWGGINFSCCYSSSREKTDRALTTKKWDNIISQIFVLENDGNFVGCILIGNKQQRGWQKDFRVASSHHPEERGSFKGKNIMQPTLKSNWSPSPILFVQ